MDTLLGDDHLDTFSDILAPVKGPILPCGLISIKCLLFCENVLLLLFEWVPTTFYDSFKCLVALYDEIGLCLKVLFRGCNEQNLYFHENKLKTNKLILTVAKVCDYHLYSSFNSAIVSDNCLLICRLSTLDRFWPK